MRRLDATFTLLLLGCGSGPGDSAGSTPVQGCDEEVPPDAYVADIERLTLAGQVVRITDAVPAPPDVGINQFVVETPGTTPASVRLHPWMPRHGHGTSPESFDSVPDGTAHQFTGVDLFMPGLWELRFTLDSDDPDTGALFRFCLEG